MHRRRTLLAAGAAGILLPVASGLRAQTFPARSLKLVVPLPPGGPMDIVGRLLAREMEKNLGQPVIVENMVGAAGMVAVRNVSRMAPDGLTVVLVPPAPLVIYPTLDPQLPYKVSELAPIGQVYETSLMLSVPGTSSFRTLADFVNHARANPGKLNYGHTGAPATSYLAMELFKSIAGIDVLDVPFRGDAPIIVEMLAGRLDASTVTYTAAAQHVAEGKIRMLATFAPRRTVALPDVPTAVEAGFPGAIATSWVGMFAPAGTPAAIVSRLNESLVAALATTSVRERMQSLDVPPAPSTPQALIALVQSETAKWVPHLKKLNVKLPQ